MILSAADRRTLTNVARVVRSLGDTPLAQHFDAFVERITADPVPLASVATSLWLARATSHPAPE